MPQNLFNEGSVDGLMPSTNKPSPEPMLTYIYVATCSDMGTMCLQNAARA